jgi:hypothetical protein
LAYDSDKLLQRQRLCSKCNSFITYTRNDEGDFRCPLCEKLGVKPTLVRAPLSAQALIEALHKHQDDVGADHPLYNSFEAALDRRMMRFPFDNAPQDEIVKKDASADADADADADAAASSGESNDAEGADDAKTSEGDDEAAE